GQLHQRAAGLDVPGDHGFNEPVLAPDIIAAGKPTNAYIEQVAMTFLEYYAFEAQNPSEIARAITGSSLVRACDCLCTRHSGTTRTTRCRSHGGTSTIAC